MVWKVARFALTLMALPAAGALAAVVTVIYYFNEPPQ